MVQQLLNRVASAQAKTYKISLDSRSTLYSEFSGALTEAGYIFDINPGKKGFVNFIIKTKWKKKN